MRKAHLAIPAVLGLVTLILFGLHWRGVARMRGINIDILAENALPRGARRGGTVWDDNLWQFTERFGRLKTRVTTRPFGDPVDAAMMIIPPQRMGMEAEEHHGTLRQLAPTLEPGMDDLDWFVRTFTPTDAVLDDLRRNEPLLRGWHAYRSFFDAADFALLFGKVAAATDRHQRALDIYLAVWTASAIVSRGIHADSSILACMTGISRMNAAQGEMAWLLMGQSPPPEVARSIVQQSKRLATTPIDFSALLEGERTMAHRVDRYVRNHLGLVTYHSMTLFAGRASVQIDRLYDRLQKSLEQPPHRAIARIQSIFDDLVDSRMHPIVAFTTPSMAAAYPRILRHHLLLTLIPLIPEMVEPDSSSIAPKDPLTGQSLSVGVLPLGSRIRLTIEAGEPPSPLVDMVLLAPR